MTLSALHGISVLSWLRYASNSCNTVGHMCIRAACQGTGGLDCSGLVQAEGLTKLVEHNNKKVAEKQLEGLKTELAEMITQDPPTPVEDCLAAVKAKKAEFALADAELVKVSFFYSRVIFFLFNFWLSALFSFSTTSAELQCMMSILLVHSIPTTCLVVYDATDD